MFWRVAGLATASPVDGMLDREHYTLEELLDEDDLIQECKSMNSRLITFLRAKEQVLKMVQYVVEAPPEGADDRRNYKFPFISCEVFTCEIDQILNTVLEEPEILDLLFSFPQPDRPHSNLLSGYFSKVINSLLLRKTAEIMAYLQAHQEILPQLVDLIGTTSIMEVIMRLVGAHDEILMYHSEKLEWLADTPLLDLLVDQLGPQKASDIQVNTAEVLSAIARTTPAALALKLASPEYVHKLFHHVLEEPRSMTSVINSLSVCITLLGARRWGGPGAAPGHPGGAQGFRMGQHQHQHQHQQQQQQQQQQGQGQGQEGGQLDAAMAQTIGGMLERLGPLLELLDTSKDEHVLATTYGQLHPPLGIHRLKIVEFIVVLIASQSESVFKELIKLGGIKRCLDLMLMYHFNNFLHHHVERMVVTILESGNEEVLDHLFHECNLLNRILNAYEEPHAPDTRPEPRAEVMRAPARSGYMGHLTRIANRIAQLCNSSPLVDGLVAKNEAWVEWQKTSLKRRNTLENVYQWQCGRPASLDDRPAESDEDDFNRPDHDYDISSNISLVSNSTRSYQSQYGQPMLDTEPSEEAQESSTASFDIQMGNAEQGMTELRIHDMATGPSEEGGAEEVVEGTTGSTFDAVQSGTGETQDAASGLVSLMEHTTQEDQSSSSVSMDTTQSSFASSDGGSVAWIAFQDEQQQQQQQMMHPPPSAPEAPEAPETSTERALPPSLNVSPLSPAAALEAPRQHTPRPAAPPSPETESLAAPSVSPDGASIIEEAATGPPVVDLFADAPPEFRVYPPLLVAQDSTAPLTPAAAEDTAQNLRMEEQQIPVEGPVAMEMDVPPEAVGCAVAEPEVVASEMMAVAPEVVAPDVAAAEVVVPAVVGAAAAEDRSEQDRVGLEKGGAVGGGALEGSQGETTIGVPVEEAGPEVSGAASAPEHGAQISQNVPEASAEGHEAVAAPDALTVAQAEGQGAGKPALASAPIAAEELTGSQ